MPPKTIYLTGASGYFGGQLLRDIASRPDDFKKVYVPVRGKKGQTGEERFRALFGSFGAVCEFVPSEAPIPEDTNVVILNAYSISFQNDVVDTLEQNVLPILGLMDQCKALQDLDTVLVVSTAYVQPPLPFRLCKGPIPCHASADPEGTFQAVLNGSITWDQLQADPRNHPHTSENAYIYSKTLLEHVINHRYKDVLPLTVFRPSMISISSDGKYGSRFTPPCATGMLAQSQVGRVFPGSAHADHVYVDHVSRLLLDSVLREGTLGEMSYVMGTGDSSVRPQEFKQRVQGKGCHTFFFDKGFPVWVVWLLRWAELFVYRLVLGPKMSQRIGACYSMYDHFLTESFEFENNLPLELEQYYAKMAQWLDENPPPKPAAPKRVEYPKLYHVTTKGQSSALTAFVTMVVFGSIACAHVITDEAATWPGLS